MKIATYLSKNRFLLIGILLLIFLRIPSLFEPMWYVDEGMYATISRHLNNGYNLYTEIYDHKPPLLFYIYALLGEDQILFKARLLNILLGIISIIGIFAFAKKYFSPRVAKTAFLLSAVLLGSPIIEGNIANAENFFLPLTIWGSYFALSYNKKINFLAGIMFGIAFMIKFHPLLTLFAVLFYYLLSYFNKRKQLIQKLFLIFVGFLVPILITAILLFLSGDLVSFIDAAYLDAFRYAGEIQSGTQIGQILQSTVFKTGMLIFALGLIFFQFKRNRISQQTLLIISLLVFELYAVFLSGRAYYHYFLQAVFSISIFLAIYMQRIRQANLQHQLVQILALIGVVISVFYYFNNLSWRDYKRETRSLPDNLFAIEYYANFLSFLGGHKDSASYNSFFGPEAEKAELLNQSLSDENQNLYIYADYAWAYVAAEKFSPTRIFVAFQIFYSREYREQTINEIEQKQVEYIVAEKGRHKFKELRELLAKDYSLSFENQYFEYYQKSRLD